MAKGDIASAIGAKVTLLRTQRSQLPKQHTSVAKTLMGLARLEAMDGRAESGVPRFAEAVEILEQVLGPDDSWLLDARAEAASWQLVSRLPASVQRQLVRADFQSRSSEVETTPAGYGRRIQELRDALQTFEQHIGRDNSFYATAMLNLGVACQTSGDLPAAARALEDAIPLMNDVYRGRSLHLVTAFSQLAALNENLTDRERSLVLYRQAVDMAEQLEGPLSEPYVSELRQLANALSGSGNVAEAIRTLELAVELSADVDDLSQLEIGQMQSDLAHLYIEARQPERGRYFANRAIDTFRAANAQGHPFYVNALNHIAMLEYKAGGRDSAEEHFRELVVAARRIYGAEHRMYAKFLASAASFHQALGRHDLARPMLREAVGILRQELDASYGAQSEQQQLTRSADIRGFLFGYVTSCVALGDNTEETYSDLLPWKGAVFRERYRDENSETAPRERLLQLASQMSALVYSGRESPDESVLITELDELRAERELLERQNRLRLQGDVSKSRKQADDSLDKLKSLLPENVALLDFLFYNHFFEDSKRPDKSVPWEPRGLVFVVRRNRPVAIVPLGGMAAIDAAIDDWRSRVLAAGASIPARPPGKPAISVPGAALDELVWRPIESHLDGVSIVAVSPDSRIGQIPFGALPNARTGRYLIEDYAFATVPFAQVLPGMLSQRSARPQSDRSLLLAGDVSYGKYLPPADPLVAARHGAASFAPLPGTAIEIKAIERAFVETAPDRRLTLMSGSNASESRFRQLAGQNRYLHLATHGFFISRLPSSVKSNENAPDHIQYLTERVPGLLCGIVMAGANDRRSTSAGDSLESSDDGILTALEVAELDLHNVDLATLSACETTLGQIPEGEGMLGLQRAFQVAGVRSTVTSLWSVDDSATQTLMTEFYRNLWERDLGKLESLRQAQLTLIRDYDPQARKLRARGLSLQQKPNSEGASRLSPYYWAPFILSGDWR